MLTEPFGSLVVSAWWARQNEHPQVRSWVSMGICERRRLRPQKVAAVIAAPMFR